MERKHGAQWRKKGGATEANRLNHQRRAPLMAQVDERARSVQLAEADFAKLNAVADPAQRAAEELCLRRAKAASELHSELTVKHGTTQYLMAEIRSIRQRRQSEKQAAPNAAAGDGRAASGGE